MGKIMFFALLSALHMAHPFYLSVTDLKYNAGEKALEGSVKLFVSDLEDALKKLYKKPVDLIHVKDSAATAAMLTDYLSRHLQLQANGKARKLELIGFEREEEAVWMYVVFKSEQPVTIKIQNTLLFDYLRDQSNIVHLQVNGESKSSKANYPDRDFSFDFLK